MHSVVKCTKSLLESNYPHDLQTIWSHKFEGLNKTLLLTAILSVILRSSCCIETYYLMTLAKQNVLFANESYIFCRDLRSTYRNYTGTRELKNRRQKYYFKSVIIEYTLFLSQYCHSIAKNKMLSITVCRVSTHVTFSFNVPT
jgi:hypothetical protein